MSARHRHQWEVCNDSCCDGKREWCRDGGCSATRFHSVAMRLSLKWPLWNVVQFMRHWSWS